MDASKFLSVLSFTLIIASAFSESNAVPICGRTSNPALCNAIVQADRRPGLKTSLEGVGTILKDKAVYEAVSSTARFSSLIRTTRSKQVVGVLRTCSQAYSSAIPALKSADFRRFNYGTLVGDISAGSDAAHECKTSFQEPGIGRSPVEREVQSLIDICAIALEIVNLRQCNRASFC